MRIISSFKDYYDYCQGVYGVDEKIIYERIPESLDGRWQTPFEEYTSHKRSLFIPDHITSYPQVGKLYYYTLYICGEQHYVFYFREKYFFGEEGAKEIISGYTIDQFYKTFPQHEREALWRASPPRFFLPSRHNEGVKYNEVFSCPVLLKGNLYSFEKNVRLQDFSIGSIIKPEDMYIKLSSWLSREKPVVDTRTDVQKIEGHGFDKKTSFRKM